MILSVTLLRRRTHSLTRPPASFSASTAPLWVTSLTSVSFTRTIQSFTLHRQAEETYHQAMHGNENLSETSGVKGEWSTPPPRCLCVHSPEPPVLGCSPSRYNLCDEDRRVIPDVRIIGATCDTEAQT